jgi:hypothetical protein
MYVDMTDDLLLWLMAVSMRFSDLRQVNAVVEAFYNY